MGTAERGRGRGRAGGAAGRQADRRAGERRGAAGSRAITINMAQAKASVYLKESQARGVYGKDTQKGKHKQSQPVLKSIQSTKISHYVRQQNQQC